MVKDKTTPNSYSSKKRIFIGRAEKSLHLE